MGDNGSNKIEGMEKGHKEEMRREVSVRLVTMDGCPQKVLPEKQDTEYNKM